MKFKNIYFINGNAYAGKSTLVKELARKYNATACEENYHNDYLGELDKKQFPNLTYTRDLEDWHDFIRRSPDEYERWIIGVSQDCEILELRILENLCYQEKTVFVDTNISLETLRKVSDREHVLIMLADPQISVDRFFNRPDKEKQFLYRLLMEEPNPDAAMDNFRQCLSRINSIQNYNTFLHSGFKVLLRDDNRTIEETIALAEKYLGLSP